MEYMTIEGQFPRLCGSAVTLGKFDGVHKGHRKLISRILDQKKRNRGSSSCDCFCFRQKNNFYKSRTQGSFGTFGSRRAFRMSAEQ